MNKQPELDLLVDLAKLIRKHGPEAFENLTETVSSGEFARQLELILQTGTRAARKIPSQRRPDSVREVLGRLKGKDPEKHGLLLQFYDALKEKRVLATLQSVRTFAQAQGLAGLENVLRREKAVAELVTRLASLPLEQAKEMVATAPEHQIDSERGLAGWADIIMQTGRRKGKEN
jgi:hypothetical protein